MVRGYDGGGRMTDQHCSEGRQPVFVDNLPLGMQSALLGVFDEHISDAGACTKRNNRYVPHRSWKQQRCPLKSQGSIAAE